MVDPPLFQKECVALAQPMTISNIPQKTKVHNTRQDITLHISSHSAPCQHIQMLNSWQPGCLPCLAIQTWTLESITSMPLNP